MIPFLTQAVRFGYPLARAMGFLGQNSPQVGSFIGRALQIGYPLQQIAGFVNEQMAGDPRAKYYGKALALAKQKRPTAMKRLSHNDDVGFRAFQAFLPALISGADYLYQSRGRIAALGKAQQPGEELLGQEGQQQAPQAGIPQPGMPQTGVPQPGEAQAGMPQPGMTQKQAPMGIPTAGQPAEQPPVGQRGMQQPAMPVEQQAPQSGIPQQQAPVSSLQLIMQTGKGDEFMRLGGKTNNPNMFYQGVEKILGKPFVDQVGQVAGKPGAQVVIEAFNELKTPQMPKSTGVARAPEQPKRSWLEPAQMQPAEEAIPQPQASEDKNALRKSALDQISKQIGSIGGLYNPSGIGKRMISPRANVREAQFLPSSNVRYADYNPDTKELQVLFSSKGSKGPGDVYSYKDIPPEDVSKFMGAEATAKTTGMTDRRSFFTGKNPSYGAALDQFIKTKNPDGSYKYAYEKIGKERYSKKAFELMRAADHVDAVSDFLDVFSDLKTKSKAKIQTQDMLNSLENAKDIPYDTLYDSVLEVLKELGPGKRSFGKNQYLVEEPIRRAKERVGQR